jgi:transposase
VQVLELGLLKFRHSGALPEGNIKAARLCRKPRGWYLTLFVDAEPRPVPLVCDGEVGVDLGYETLATLAPVNGPAEKVPHPRERHRLA